MSNVIKLKCVLLSARLAFLPLSGQININNFSQISKVKALKLGFLIILCLCLIKEVVVSEGGVGSFQSGRRRR